jgi:flagellar basal-body rod protein FlgB
MPFENSAIMHMMEVQMAYRTQRQTEISKNIMNIDTPGYEARDLKPVNFDKMVEAQLNRLEVRTTSNYHLPGVRPISGPFGDQKMRKTFETTPVGNNVVLEEQAANASQNNAMYQLTTNLYRKYAGFYRTAALGAR